jgi:hypothetical protein
MSKMTPDSLVGPAAGMLHQAYASGMTTVPLPALASVSPEPFQDASPVQSEQQGMIFVSLSNETPVEVKEEGIKDEKPHTFSEEQVGAVQIFRDTCKCRYKNKADGVAEDGTLCRTRLEACRIENREFELAEGFKDLSDDHSNNTASWDWVGQFTTYIITADGARLPYHALRCHRYHQKAGRS